MGPESILSVVTITSKYEVTLIPRSQYHDVSFRLITPLGAIRHHLHNFYDYVHRAASNNLLSSTAPRATSNKYAIYLLASKGPEICANENLGIFITSAKPLLITNSYGLRIYRYTYREWLLGRRHKDGEPVLVQQVGIL
jgi:hypothetical protein